MLVAELHGKCCPEARESEDYLTSAVFGHLRYVPPDLFWDRLLAQARGLPGPDGAEYSLFGELGARQLLPSSYERLRAHFWPSHPTHGEPDLLLVFTSAGKPPLILLIEAKLWSGKSGTGERDQLARYLRLLEDLPEIGVSGAPASSYLVYLTPREALNELEETVRTATVSTEGRRRLFRLRWQDVERAARATTPATEPTSTILADVAAFLARVGLEYFGGFHRLDGLPELNARDGRFYQPNASRPGTSFGGFVQVAGLSPLVVRSEGWVR